MFIVEHHRTYNILLIKNVGLKVFGFVRNCSVENILQHNQTFVKSFLLDFVSLDICTKIAQVVCDIFGVFAIQKRGNTFGFLG